MVAWRAPQNVLFTNERSYVDGDLICDALLNGVQSAGTGWQYFEAISRVGGKSHKGKLLVLSLPKVSHLATI